MFVLNTQKVKTVLLRLLILLALAACSGDDGGAGGGGGGGSTPAPPTGSPPAPPAPPPPTPWEQAGDAQIPDPAAITATERQLAFDDGMTVSYDATDPNNEEVCRMEEVGGQELSVCMGLEETGSPLLFGGFGSASARVHAKEIRDLWGEDFFLEMQFVSTLTCYVDGASTPCVTVFQAISSETGTSFNCESGLVNGDKALRCSDDWAVVVNGEEGGGNSKTICRVNLSDNSGRCLGAPKRIDTDDDGILDTEVEVEELVLEMQKTAWEGYATSYYNPAQMLYTEGLDPVALVDSPAGDVTADYVSKTLTVCTVDNDNDSNNGVRGRITPDGDSNNKGICKIVLKVEAANFVDRIFEREIETVEQNDTTWDGYPNAAMSIGGTQAPNALGDEIASPAYTYTSQDTSICTVNSTNGEIEGVAMGDCQIVLLASSGSTPLGYLEKEIAAPVVFVRGQQAGITWSPSVSGTVGADLLLAAVAGADASAVVNYVVAAAGTTGCAWRSSDASTRTLFFTNAGTCRVRATVSRTGYDDWTSIADIVVALGTQGGISWSPVTAGTVGDELLLAAVAGADTTAAINYAVTDAGATGCAFKGNSGADARTLIFTNAGTCKVQASATRTGYQTWTSPEISVSVALGTQGGISWSPVTAGTVGAELLLAAVAGADTTAAINYAVTDAGATACAWKGNSGADAHTLIFTNIGTCKVQASATLTGYQTWTSPEVSINVGPGAFVGLSWTPGTATFLVGDSPATLNPVATVGDVTGDASYTVSDAGTTSCAFSTATVPVLTFSAAGTCKVKAKVAKTGYNPWESSDHDISISDLPPVGITWTGYANSNTATVGQAAPALQAPTLNPASADASYSATPSGVCTVDSSTGALTIVGAGSCEVSLTATPADPSTHVPGMESVTVTVNPGTQTVTFNQPYGSGTPVLIVEGFLALENVPTGGETSLEYQSTDADVCTVHDSSGDVTGDAVGTCQVQARWVASDDYNPSGWTTIHTFSVGQGNQAAPTGSNVYGNSPTLAAGGTLAVENTPSGGGGHGTLEYDSTTTSVCTVDDTTGTVTGVTVGACTIRVRWKGDANYNPSPWLDNILSITLTQGTQALPTANNPYGANPQVQVDGTLAIDTAPASGQGSLEFRSSNTSACTVVADGTVTGVSRTGTCTIESRWGATADYTASNWGILATITVAKGDQAAPSASDIYGSSPALATGGTLGRQSLPTGGGGHGVAEYQTTTGTICSVALANGEVEALLDGNCVVQARWKGNNDYVPSPWETMQTVAIARGMLTVANWGSFTGNLVIGGSTVTPSAPSFTTQGVMHSYALDTGELDCVLVDSATGEVRANVVAMPASCSVEITATKNGYNDATQTIVIPLQAGTLDMVSAGNPGHSGVLRIGGSALPVQSPPASDDNGVALSWAYVAEGVRYGAPRSNICAVAANGDLSIGTDAQTGDICRIVATASSTGYAEYSAPEIEFTVAPGTQTGLAWNPAPTSGTVGRDIVLTAVTGVPNGALVHYEVDAPGTTNCFFRGADGALARTLAFSAGGTCTVRAVSTHPSFEDWESSDSSITIAANSAYPTQFSARGNSACARFSDGTLKCWGSNTDGPLGVGDEVDRGDDPNEMGGALPFVDVSGDGDVASVETSTYRHTCAIVTDGSLKCWGDNYQFGALGLGSIGVPKTSPPNVKVNLGAGRTASAVSLGTQYTCALLDDSTVKCWGRNTEGQLGLGNTTAQSSPAGTVDLGTGKTALAVSAGHYHACALLNDNTVKCWGRNTEGQLGLGNTDNRGDGVSEMGDNLPAVDLGTGKTALAVSAGRGHTCALLNDNTVKCWGENGSGKLGLGDTDSRGDSASEMGDNLPAVDLGAGKTALAVSAGSDHTCALLNDNTVKCWGENGYGELGLGNTDNRGDGVSEMGDNLPAVDLGTGKTALAVNVSGRTCAFLNDNTVKCWGEFSYGYGGIETIGDDAGEMGDNLPAIPILTEGNRLSSVAWASFPGSAVVGVDATLAAPTSTPALDDWSARKIAGDCTWNDNNNRLSFSGTSTCSIALQVNKLGYASTTQIFSVTPSPAPQTGVSWAAGTDQMAWGTEVLLGAVQGADVSADILYLVVDAGSTSCSFKGTGDPDERTLIASSQGTCQVRAVSVRDDYQAWLSPITDIQVKEGQSPVVVPNDPYGSNPSMAVLETLAAVSFPSGGYGTLEYRSADATICTVATNGQVTGVGAGTCTVQVRWPGDDTYVFTPWADFLIVEVDKGNQILTAPTNPYGANPYICRDADGSADAASKVLNIVNAPTGGATTLEYTVNTNTGCSINSSTGELKYWWGSNTTCTVRARWRADTNYNESSWVQIASVQAYGNGNCPNPNP